jgi:hydrogenase maturation protease
MVVDRCVIGVGSSHGDDQVGWLLVDAVARTPLPGTRFVVAGCPADLLDCVRECRSLVIVDACQRGDAPGTMTSFTWPWPSESPNIAAPARSTHGMSVSSALALAQRLRILPPDVELLAIEVQACVPGTSLSPALQRRLPQLAACLRRHLAATDLSSCRVGIDRSPSLAGES